MWYVNGGEDSWARAEEGREGRVRMGEGGRERGRGRRKVRAANTAVEGS